MGKMGKLKLKNNKKNVFYNIMGRVTVYGILYGASVWVFYKILKYILFNCITTL